MKNKIEILKEFRTSIRCGTGKAYLLMEKYPQMNFTNELYKASIKNYAYDGQSEGDRTDYLIPFIELLTPKQVEFYKKKIIKRLFKEEEDTWNLQQLFTLTGYFAEADSKVKKAIYKRFKQTPIQDSDWVGTGIILKLDGAEGMIQIVEHFGKRLLKFKDEWQDDWILNHFDEKNPNLKIKKVLKKKAETNKYIRKYLKEIKATKQRRNKNKQKRKEWTIDTIIESILDNSMRTPMFWVIEKLKKSEIKRIAKLLHSNLQEKQIEKLLYIFTLVKYPFDKEDLKLFLKKKYPKHIREYAYQSLSFFSDLQLRTEAIANLNSTKNPSVQLDLLKSNYKKGDSKIITNTINRFNDEHIIEQIAISLCDVYQDNPTSDCKKPLLALYKKMNCGIHRNSILKILYKNNVLPSSVLKEIQFDSDEDTRKLYHKIIKKQG